MKKNKDIRDIKSTKKIKGYEITTFIEEKNYKRLKNKAQKENSTIDLLLEKIINNI